LPESAQIRVEIGLSEAVGRSTNSGDALAGDDREVREVQLVHQVVRQEVVSEGPAAVDEDVAARARFESGDLRVGVRQAHDPRVRPGRQLERLQVVGDDQLVGRPLPS
jgi:hypothetical protein